MPCRPRRDGLKAGISVKLRSEKHARKGEVRIRGAKREEEEGMYAAISKTKAKHLVHEENCEERVFKMRGAMATLFASPPTLHTSQLKKEKEGTQLSVLTQLGRIFVQLMADVLVALKFNRAQLAKVATRLEAVEEVVRLALKGLRRHAQVGKGQGALA